MYPVEYGCDICSSTGLLTPVQEYSEVCPRAISQILSCSCRKSCSTNQCGCKRLGLFRTDICNCQDECCQNKNVIFDEDDETEDDDEDNYDDNY